MARVRTETAAVVRRVVSRGLLVVGGVVAGTAAAWLLSSATASAETQSPSGLGSARLPSVAAAQPQLTQNPLARNATKAVKDVDEVVKATAHGVTAPSQAPIDLSSVVGDLDATLHGQDADKPTGLNALGHKAKDAVDEVGADLAEQLGWKRSGAHVDAPQDVPPAAGGQPGNSFPIVGPTAHAPVAGPRVATDSITAPTVQDRLRMGGLNRGSPVPSLPDQLPAPVLPLPAPVGSSGHSSSTGGAPDGPAVGALSLTGFRTAFAVFGTSRSAIAGAPVHTGAQPGNTPD